MTFHANGNFWNARAQKITACQELPPHQPFAAMSWTLSMWGTSAASNISFHVLITFNAKIFCCVKHQLPCHDHFQCMKLPPRQPFAAMSWLLSMQGISAASNINYHVMITFKAKNFWCIKHQLPCHDHFQCMDLPLHPSFAAMSWLLSMQGISAASNISCYVMITFNAKNFCCVKHQLPCRDCLRCKEFPQRQISAAMSWSLSRQRTSAASNISCDVMITLNAWIFHRVNHLLSCHDHFQGK